MFNSSDAPTSVSIKTPKEAKPGDLIVATCKTEPSNPASEITWVVDGRPMASENVVEAAANGGWVTTSKININITQQVWICVFEKFFVINLIFFHILKYLKLFISLNWEMT